MRLLQGERAIPLAMTFAALMLAGPVLGQVGEPVLLADINPGPAHSHPASFQGEWTLVNARIFFIASDGSERRLWRTDATPGGTVPLPESPLGIRRLVGRPDGSALFAVIDRAPEPIEELWVADGAGNEWSILLATWLIHWDELILVNGKLYFAADDQLSGRRLWVSDGTFAGTRMLAPFLRAERGLLLGVETATGGGMVFFSADDGVHGSELWKTDGTAEGTVMVADINPGSEGSYPWAAYGVAKKSRVTAPLVFAADDGTHGWEPWRSDGTAQGTWMVEDIVPGPAGSGTNAEFFDLGALRLFAASDGEHGQELWKTEGSFEGAAMVADINPGPGSGIRSGRFDTTGFEDLATVNGVALFQADDGETGREIWRSDGTGAGTMLLKDIAPGRYPSYPWAFRSAGDTVYFNAEDLLHGEEIWRSDGTSDGTMMVGDLYPGPDSSVSYPYGEIGGALVFSGWLDDAGSEPWKLDLELPVIEALEGLIEDVRALNLQKGIENSLDVKLEAALRALEDVKQGNDGSAINTLAAFRQEVNAQRGQMLDEAGADALGGSAQRLIDRLSGS
jgi:ELWxxDGT repeat protein